ncbi:MAG: hypothetical protein ACRDIV_27095 [Ktedonobacteraceae bacterium]
MNTTEYTTSQDRLNMSAGITLAEYKRAEAELRIEEREAKIEYRARQSLSREASAA